MRHPKPAQSPLFLLDSTHLKSGRHLRPAAGVEDGLSHLAPIWPAVLGCLCRHRRMHACWVQLPRTPHVPAAESGWAGEGRTQNRCEGIGASPRLRARRGLEGARYATRSAGSGRQHNWWQLSLLSLGGPHVASVVEQPVQGGRTAAAILVGFRAKLATVDLRANGVAGSAPRSGRCEGHG